MCFFHTLLMADCHLGDTACCVARGAKVRHVVVVSEMSRYEVFCLLDGFGFGSRRLDFARVVVVAAHEDEELGSERLICTADGEAVVEHDAENAVGVVLERNGAGD